MTAVQTESTLLAQTIVVANEAAASALLAQQAAAETAGKAPLDSPAFTGTPTAPTPTANNNSTRLATTAYLDRLLAQPSGVATLDVTGKIPVGQIPPITITAVYVVASEAAMLALAASIGNIAIRTDLGNSEFILTELPASTLGNWIMIGTSPVLSVAGLTGAISATDLTATLNNFVGDTGSGGSKGDVPAPAAGYGAANRLLAADGTWKNPPASCLSNGTTGSGAAVLAASPTLSGVPVTTTASVDTNTGQIASCSFVLAQASAPGDGTPAMDGTAARGTSTHYARADHVHPTDVSLAPKVSPALTGAPTAPTATPLTNSTQLATTAYADAAVAAQGGVPSCTIVFTILTSSPTGWLIFADQTIGDASSGATYANVAALAVFTALFNNASDANCPILTSSGAATTRVAQTNAATAWANHCRMTMPATLGRALAVAGSGAGLTTRAMAQAVGEETHVLTVPEIPAHHHSYIGPGSSTPNTTGSSSNTSNIDTDDTGGGLAHNNMQPTTFLNAMVKL